METLFFLAMLAALISLWFVGMALIWTDTRLRRARWTAQSTVGKDDRWVL